MNKFNKLALACAAIVWTMNVKNEITYRRNTKTLKKVLDSHDMMVARLRSLPTNPLQDELKHWTVVDPTK